MPWTRSRASWGHRRSGSCPYRNPDITVIAATSPSTLWAESRAGGVFRSLNQGVDVSDTIHRDDGVCALVTPMTGWAVAGTRVLRTVDGGQSWAVVR